MRASKESIGSGTLSGLVTGLAMLPVVLLGPVAGVFVDRVNRGRLIAWTDVAGGALVSAAVAVFFPVPGSRRFGAFLSKPAEGGSLLLATPWTENPSCCPRCSIVWWVRNPCRLGPA